MIYAPGEAERPLGFRGLWSPETAWPWANRVLVALFAAWLPASMMLLRANGASLAMYWADLAYCLLGISIAAARRYRLSSPEFLVTVIGFLGYGLPFARSGDWGSPRLDYYVSAAVWTWAFVVFMIAWLAFIAGCAFPILRGAPCKWVLASGKGRKASAALFALIAGYILVGGMVRHIFRIGVAGEVPQVAFAGVLQYLCYLGPTLAALWYFGLALRERNLPHVMLAVCGLVLIGVIQATLKWRGSMLSLSISAMVLFSLCTSGLGIRERHWNRHWITILLASCVVLAVAAAGTFEFGQRNRAEYDGATYEAVTPGVWLDQRLRRFQGLPRLAAVVDHFGISGANRFFGFELIREDLSTTAYADRRIFRIPKDAITSNGTSGPGGPYIMAGVLGVLAAFFLWGGFWASVHAHVTQSESLVGYAFFASSTSLLTHTMNETFGLDILKALVAAIVLSKILSWWAIVPDRCRTSTGAAAATSRLM